MSQGGNSEQLLFFALFYQNTPSCLKVVGGVGGGGPCDYCVIPSPFGLDFGTLDFGTSDLGLTINCPCNSRFVPIDCKSSPNISARRAQLHLKSKLIDKPELKPFSAFFLVR